MSYIYNLTDTWNAGGTTFAGIKMAVTNTASSASSKLLDLSVSGATTGSFTVDKSGNASFSGALTLGTALSVANGGTGLASLTAGYIPFGLSASAFGSSSNIFWDNANARLGIGTASPVSKLHLSDTAGMSLVMDSTVSGASGIQMFASSAGLAAFNSVASKYGGSTGWLIGGVGAVDTLGIHTAGVERARFNASGLAIGTSTFGSSAASVLAIATGTAPTTGPADTIQLYSSDLSAGNTMLSLYTEGTSVNSSTTNTTTHKIAIRVNGTVYYLLANTSST